MALYKSDLPKKVPTEELPGGGAHSLALDRSVYVNSGLNSSHVSQHACPQLGLII